AIKAITISARTHRQREWDILAARNVDPPQAVHEPHWTGHAMEREPSCEPSALRGLNQLRHLDSFDLIPELRIAFHQAVAAEPRHRHVIGRPHTEREAFAAIKDVANQLGCWSELV